MSMILTLSFFLLFSSIVFAAKECKQPNYISEARQIFAVNPDNPLDRKPIRIRGVTWRGMEARDGIPMGLYGENYKRGGVQGTSIPKVISFLHENEFNSIRIPLNIDSINSDKPPKMSNIHSYENRIVFPSPKYFDLISKLVRAFQDKKITVLLDLHLLSYYPKDAFWYQDTYQPTEKTPIYEAVSYLAKAFCGHAHWNILGIDLKDEMLSARWGKGVRIEENWQAAAQKLGDRINSLCPKWLVFVQGAGPSDVVEVSSSFPVKTSDWLGGNLRNATNNPVKLKNTKNKIVYAPHANTHGVYPKSYFYSSTSNCSLKSEFSSSKCVDFENGNRLAKPVYRCSQSSFHCANVKHQSKRGLTKNYNDVLQGAFLKFAKKTDNAMILGSFAGVYGVHQPQQTLAMDYLISVASTNLNGGYFWSLNPDTEYYLESPLVKGENGYPGSKGTFGKTHFGLMQLKNWQKPNEDLLNALKKLPTSDIPCFGEKIEESDANRSVGMSRTYLRIWLSVCSILASYCIL